MIDKAAILNALKKHYNFSSNKEFADFLEIKPQTLSNWYARNTFDYEILYTKCLDINSEWLFTGNGEMLKAGKKDSTNELNTQNNISEPITEYESEYQKKYILKLEQDTKNLQEQIINLTKENEKKQALIDKFISGEVTISPKDKK